MDIRTKLLQAMALLGEIADGVSREVIQFHTNLDIIQRGPDGAIIDERHIHNLVCTAGKNTILAYTGAEYLNQYAYIGVGTGTTAAAITDTALQTPVARQIGTLSNPTANVLQISTTFAAGVATGAITESGLFNAGSSGIMLAHQIFSVLNIGASDTLAINWAIS